jgi:predicted N-acetyltransferase YhbS
MSESKFEIRLETPADRENIQNLHALAFGPGRFVRTANRMREGVPPVTGLCHAGWLDASLIASVKLTKVVVELSEGLLLGPIVVHPDFANRGFGQVLIRNAIAEARRAGFRWIILVGDAPYYEKVGFVKSPRGKITFPGPVDPDRVMVLELEAGSLDRVSGQLSAPLPEPGCAEQSE